MDCVRVAATDRDISLPDSASNARQPGGETSGADVPQPSASSKVNKEMTWRRTGSNSVGGQGNRKRSHACAQRTHAATVAAHEKLRKQRSVSHDHIAPSSVALIASMACFMTLARISTSPVEFVLAVAASVSHCRSLPIGQAETWNWTPCATFRFTWGWYIGMQGIAPADTAGQHDV